MVVVQEKYFYSYIKNPEDSLRDFFIPMEYFILRIIPSGVLEYSIAGPPLPLRDISLHQTQTLHLPQLRWLPVK